MVHMDFGSFGMGLGFEANVGSADLGSPIITARLNNMKKFLLLIREVVIKRETAGVFQYIQQGR